MRWSVRVSPFVIIQSGAPFDITAGSDLYGTTLFNGRPAIAKNPNKPGLLLTRYGLLDPNPSLGERLLSRNYGRGPGQITMNLKSPKRSDSGRNAENRAVTHGRVRVRVKEQAWLRPRLRAEAWAA